MSCVLDESQDVLYSHRDGRVYTFLTEDNRCLWTGETLAQIGLKEGPDRLLEIMPLRIAENLAHEFARRRHCKGPKPIDRAAFHDMLNIMPPVNWHAGGFSESFMLSELITDEIATYYVRIQNQFFKINELKGKGHDELVALCSIAFRNAYRKT